MCDRRLRVPEVFDQFQVTAPVHLEPGDLPHRKASALHRRQSVVREFHRFEAGPGEIPDFGVRHPRLPFVHVWRVGKAGLELTELGLPESTLLIALVGFNLGVEVGQVAIVAVFLPLAFALRETWVYQRLVLVAGSLLIAVVAAAWLVERAFGMKFMPI